VAGEPLSAGARYFITTHIRSVRQLELLLLLHAGAARHWTAHEVAAHLRVAEAWAAAELDAMRAAGLLASDGEADPAYCYAAPAADDRWVAELAEAYLRRKTTVIHAVLNAMDSDVKALSDAFRLRRPRDG
jgi:hypothetical protein